MHVDDIEGKERLVTERSQDKPRADDDTPVKQGTASGDPVAGVELDRDEAPPVVSGDTGPEGNRQTGLAPPME